MRISWKELSLSLLIILVLLLGTVGLRYWWLQRNEEITQQNACHKPIKNDANSYWPRICEYIKAEFPGEKLPHYTAVKFVRETRLKDGREVIEVVLDCCHTGDIAYIDKETGRVVRFDLGDL